MRLVTDDQTHFKNGIIRTITLSLEAANDAAEQLSYVEWIPSTVGYKHNVFRVRELIDSHQRHALSIGVDRASQISCHLIDSILPKALKIIKKYWNIKVNRYSGQQFTRYDAGHFIRLHKDSGAAYPDRLFTVVTYLNTDYCGGEIFFPRFGERFHPAVGETLIFPCDFAHGVEAVTEGRKEIFLFFIDREPRRVRSSAPEAL